MPGRHQQGSAARTALALLLVLLVGLALGVGGTYTWLHRQRAATSVPAGLPPPPPIVPSPVDVAAPSPSPSALVIVPSVEVTPALEAKPHADRVRVARAVPPAGSASRPVAPIETPRPPEPVAPVPPADAHTGRRFVQGATSVESRKPVGTSLRGFDTSEVDVKRAPDQNGHLELEMDPDRVVPGQPYVVRVFLANDGSRLIELHGMKAATLVDGKWIQVPLTPESRVVAPHQRALLRELPGTWKATVRSWAVEVEVTSKRQDVYKNRLTWK